MQRDGEWYNAARAAPAATAEDPITVTPHALAATATASWSARRWAWTLGITAALLLPLALRLYHLQRYVLRGDEGVYLESLVLMARGYLPYRDFFSSQGPLFLPLLYPFSLLGAGVLWPRLGVVGFATLGMLATAALARRLGGAVAGVAALLLLGLSPDSLYVSRLTLAETPAAALGAAALWSAARAPSRRWLALAGALLAAALLIKPLVAPLAVGVALLALAARWRARAWRALALDVGVVLAAGGAVVVVTILPLGPGAVADQFVEFHVAVTHVEQRGRVAGGWDNLESALPWLQKEGAGLYMLAAVGLLAALRERRALGLAAVLWLAGTVGVLWVYVPYYDRFLIFLMPPLAVLGGVATAEAARLRTGLSGLARAASAARPGPPSEGTIRRPRGLASNVLVVRPASPWSGIPALAAVAGVAYLAALPSVLSNDLAIADAPWEPLRLQEYQAAVDLASISAPDAFVATDNQSIAYMAGRVIAPPLVDTSEARVTSGSSKADDVIRALDQYQVNALVWWSSDRFGKLRGFQKPLDARFQSVRQYPGDRALYLRRGAPPADGTGPASDTPPAESSDT